MCINQWMLSLPEETKAIVGFDHAFVSRDGECISHCSHGKGWGVRVWLPPSDRADENKQQQYAYSDCRCFFFRPLACGEVAFQTKQQTLALGSGISDCSHGKGVGCEATARESARGGVAGVLVFVALGVSAALES